MAYVLLLYTGDYFLNDHKQKILMLLSMEQRKYEHQFALKPSKKHECVLLPFFLLPCSRIKSQTYQDTLVNILYACNNTTREKNKEMLLFSNIIWCYNVIQKYFEWELF